MKVKVTKEFDSKFFKQLDYIYDDKPKATQKFMIDVFKQIKGLSYVPYKNRQSVYIVIILLEI